MNMVKKDANNKKKRPETYRLKFIDSYRFIASRLENLVNNLVEPHKKLSILIDYVTIILINLSYH